MVAFFGGLAGGPAGSWTAGAPDGDAPNSTSACVQVSLPRGANFVALSERTKTLAAENWDLLYRSVAAHRVSRGGAAKRLAGRAPRKLDEAKGHWEAAVGAVLVDAT